MVERTEKKKKEGRATSKLVQQKKTSPGRSNNDKGTLWSNLATVREKKKKYLGKKKRWQILHPKQWPQHLPQCLPHRCWFLSVGTKCTTEWLGSLLDGCHTPERARQTFAFKHRQLRVSLSSPGMLQKGMLPYKQRCCLNDTNYGTWRWRRLAKNAKVWQIFWSCLMCDILTYYQKLQSDLHKKSKIKKGDVFRQLFHACHRKAWKKISFFFQIWGGWRCEASKQPTSLQHHNNTECPALAGSTMWEGRKEQLTLKRRNI